MTAVFVAVRDIPLGELGRFPGNARRGDVAAIRASLRRNGQYRALVVRDTGAGLVVLAGNHTRDALDAEGHGSARCEVIQCSDDEARRINLADNRLAELGGYDDADLAALLEGLDGDFDGTGWGQEDLDALLAVEPESRTDPDDVPEPPAVPVTRPGDLWLLGRHRLLCGDSRQPDDVARLFGDSRPDAVVTDPPYCSGGFQEAGRKSGSVGTRGDEMIANDTLSTRGYMALMKAVLGLCRAGVVYVFTDWRMWVNLFDVVEGSGFGVRNMIVWDKGSPGMGRGWRSQHELIMAAMRVAQPFDPKKAQGNVVQSKRTGNVLHATEKPVALIETILDVTDMARVIYDPFGGSGTTLIAAHRASRRACVMELDPRYCDVIVQRYEDHTGIKPELLEADRADQG